MRTVCLLAVVILLVSGCGATAQQASPPRVVHRMASVVRWGIVGLTDLPTLDPALASDPASISVASLVFGGLVRLNGHAQVVPDGARSWTISHRGTVYTFHLRQDLRFADGAQVTSADFVSALGRAFNSEASAGTAPLYLGLIQHGIRRVHGVARFSRGISAPDSRTVRITLSQPAAHFLAELAFPASYVPNPRVLNRYGANWTDHAAGFGPYVVRTWRHSRLLQLDRNPYYFGGKALLKSVSIRFYDRLGGALSAYRAGHLDLVSGLPPGSGVPSGLHGVRRVPALALDYLAFNTQRLPFRRTYARRAFAAIWSPQTAHSVLGQSAFVSRTILPSAFKLRGASAQPLGSASAYLARARYPNGKGFPSVTLVVPRDPHVYLVARTLQSAWSRILHVTINVRQLNASTYSQVVNARTFDLAIVRWGADYPDPQDFLGTQFGKTPDNVTGWSTPEYDKSVALADSYALTDPRRMTLFQRAAAIAALKVPIMPLDEPAVVALVSPSLHGVEVSPFLGTVTARWTDTGFVP